MDDNECDISLGNIKITSVLDDLRELEHGKIHDLPVEDFMRILREARFHSTISVGGGIGDEPISVVYERGDGQYICVQPENHDLRLPIDSLYRRKDR